MEENSVLSWKEQKLTEGAIVDGIAKNIRPYGTFVEIGEGTVGLLHIEAAAGARFSQTLGGQHLVGGIHRVDADALPGGHRAAARQGGAGGAFAAADLVRQGGVKLFVERGAALRVQCDHTEHLQLAP